MVGATFAYFSASGGSANDAVAANATTLANLGFTSANSKIATDLIPVSAQNEFFSMYQMVLGYVVSLVMVVLTVRVVSI